jgi:hypothetical protein
MPCMLIHLLMLGAVAPDPGAAQVTLKLMSFDEPQMEVTMMNAEGRPAPVTLFSHALTEPLDSRCHERRLTVYQKAKTEDPKEPLVPLASSPLPASGARFIAIISGSGSSTRLNLIPDNGGAAAAGTIRFFNLCPKPVGLSMPGTRRVLPSGQELTLHPEVKAEQYGQAQFFLPNEGGDWQVAGGLRWLQMEDIRSILFLMPAPGEEGLIKVRGVEERITADLKSPPNAPTNPSHGGDKKSAGRKIISLR